MGYIMSLTDDPVYELRSSDDLQKSSTALKASERPVQPPSKRQFEFRARLFGPIGSEYDPFTPVVRLPQRTLGGLTCF